MPDWRDEAEAAVDAWIAAEGRGSRKPELTRVGEARHDGDGWYAVDLRGRPPNPDQLDGLQLESQDRKRVYRVMETAQDGDILRVRVARHVTERGLRLIAVKKPAAMLLDNLRDRLRSLTDEGGLAAKLAHRRPDRLSADSTERLPAGFTPGQARAFLACLTPGLRLVWGPPGTGKTLVLARAIDRLLERGRRVLLVSGTNVAVDNALAEVMRTRRPPGTLVRVGTPHVQKVADDDSVALPRLVAARSAAVERERQQVEQRLVELTTPPAPQRELDALLATFDRDEYAVAAGRLEVEGRVEALRARLEELLAAAAAATVACDAAERARTETEEAWTATDLARRHLEGAAALRGEIETLDIEANRARARHAQVVGRQEAMRDHLLAASSAKGFAWLRGRAEVRRLRVQVAQLDEPVERARRDVEASQQLAGDQRRLLEPRIAGHLREAGPVDEAQVEARRAELEAARRLATETAERASDAARQVDAAREELRAADELPRATDEQRRLVAAADAAGWPALHAQRELLRSQRRSDDQEVRRLERRHDELLEQRERMARDAEREIIARAQLVATTLARSRLHPAVAAGPYDAVLVDEVGAATLVEVLVAVAAARQTAVLLGDFLQLGPVLGDIQDSHDPLVQRWVQSTCFDHCGIRTPTGARAHDACAFLDLQYRFGPDVMELANRTMYAGMLRAGRPLPRSALNDEVVLVDTDGLGEIATARAGPAGHSRWWPAGSLLAPILARHHAGPDERVGLITPYRPQADAMLEALHDTEDEGTRLLTDAGTAHGFQGREFDTVVFDLVEDGLWPGWLAGPSPAAARVLNVAVTRCRNRLYVVGSGRLVRSAPTQPRTALTPLRELLQEGRIHVVPATALLQVPEAGAPMVLDPIVDELAETLAKYVRVVGVHDEHTYFAELRRHLAEARESIWMWSPWTARRTEELLPPLRAARDRGCRVTVFVRTDDDKIMSTERAQRELARLRDATSLVVRTYGMHQKLVVVDARTVMYGSLNTLSHNNTREIMVIHQGNHFARKLLEYEQAEAFASPPGCACGAQAALWRSGAARKGYAWSWRCASRTCRWSDPVRPASATRS